jgi:hypothetical protein
VLPIGCVKIQDEIAGDNRSHSGGIDEHQSNQRLLSWKARGHDMGWSVWQALQTLFEAPGFKIQKHMNSLWLDTQFVHPPLRQHWPATKTNNCTWTSPRELYVAPLELELEPMLQP